MLFRLNNLFFLQKIWGIKNNCLSSGRRHSGRIFAKNFACSVCSFRTEKPDKLKVHMRSHTGEKRGWFYLIACHDSMAVFKRFIKNQKALIPFYMMCLFIAYVCQYCPDKRYAYHQDYRKHLETHYGKNNRYMCDKCEKGFRLHEDFKQHSFEHYKEEQQKLASTIQWNQRTSFYCWWILSRETSKWYWRYYSYTLYYLI